MDTNTPLITVTELAARLAEPNLRIFDSTVFLQHRSDGKPGYLPESGRATWQSGHIPGAVFIDLIEEFSDQSSGLPFMMPAAETFCAQMAAYGVNDDSDVIIYSSGSVMWATRLWWMLRSVGFERSRVLDGGYQKWVAERHPTTTKIPNVAAGKLRAIPKPELWADKKDILTAMEDGQVCVVNALSPEVYSGAKNQYGRPGHIPGSVNVFYGNLLDPEEATFLPPAELATRMRTAGALTAPRVICYCGGGISATMDALALTIAGHSAVAVYDGSMSEWIKDERLPLVLGEKP